MKVIETNGLFVLGEGVIELVAVPFQEVVDPYELSRRHGTVSGG